MTAAAPISLSEARARIAARVTTLEPVERSLAEAAELVAAADCPARVDCPATACSLKDGYAVISEDLAEAGPDRPVRLRVVDTLVAGGRDPSPLGPGRAARVMTGARLPAGATAVLACEYTRAEGDGVVCLRDATPGRNILPQGHDVRQGTVVVRRGDRLTPPRLGLLAAAGWATVPVHRRPRVALIGMGDELVTPGAALGPGQVYASNLVTLGAWLHRFGLHADSRLVPDRAAALATAVTEVRADHEVLLTSGGAWLSDRDLAVRTLGDLGGELVFRRLRMGPGKGVALMRLDDRWVVCLPGGPPSNEMAFLQVALPLLRRLGGLPEAAFRQQRARLSETVRGQADWTQFLQARLTRATPGDWIVTPRSRRGSRLTAQAETQALIEIPEGVEVLEAGRTLSVTVLAEAI